jgi:hypothetical protein
MAGGCTQARQGTVWFDRMNDEGAASGRFRLSTESGDRLEGDFRVKPAGEQAAICG